MYRLLFFSLMLCGWVNAGDPPFRATYSVNPLLPVSFGPMYFPSAGPKNINVVVPQGISLENIQIPSIQIGSRDIKGAVQLHIDYYTAYATAAGQSKDQIKAAYSYAADVTNNGIVSGEIDKGCTSVSRGLVNSVQKGMGKLCKVKREKATVVACLVESALNRAMVKKTAVSMVDKGCKVTVKFVAKRMVELTIDTVKGLPDAIQEAKYWMAYINSIDGMVWIMNHMK